MKLKNTLLEVVLKPLPLFLLLSCLAWLWVASLRLDLFWFPFLLCKKGITVLACMNLTIGLTAVFYSSLRQFLKYVTLAGTTSIVIAGIFYLPPHLITRAYEYAEPTAKLVHYKEGITGTITVHAYGQKGLCEKAAQNMEMFERLEPKSRV